ncbi:hypothetical protein TNCV_2458201 [Trichonephila clavipes]|nr:hypothetical protein TNCV_2458201 [Trichonephila clavipes]
MPSEKKRSRWMTLMSIQLHFLIRTSHALDCAQSWLSFEEHSSYKLFIFAMSDRKGSTTGNVHPGALPFFALPLPSTPIGSLSKQILSSETKKSRTVPNMASTARVRALECVYRPNTFSQIARYGQVPCPGAKSTSCSSTTRAISYKLVLAVLPKLTNSKSGLQSDPQEPIQSSRYR